MKISYRWIQDYVPTILTPGELGEKFQLTSSVLDDLETIDAQAYSHMVVGKVEEVRTHPNADKLRIATVSVGKELREIVCGAPNLEA